MYHPTSLFKRGFHRGPSPEQQHILPQRTWFPPQAIDGLMRFSPLTGHPKRAACSNLPQRVWFPPQAIDGLMGLPPRTGHHKHQHASRTRFPPQAIHCRPMNSYCDVHACTLCMMPKEYIARNTQLSVAHSSYWTVVIRFLEPPMRFPPRRKCSANGHDQRPAQSPTHR